MNENEPLRRTSISQASTLEEIADFWDTHSLADYWDQTQEVEFEIGAKRRRRVTLDPDVYERLETQAHIRGLQTETLANLWLAERLRDMVKAGDTKTVPVFARTTAMAEVSL